MAKQGRIGSTVYPFGNDAPAKIIGIVRIESPNKVVYAVRFIEDCIAQFPWYTITIFRTLEVIWIEGGNIYYAPMNWWGNEEKEES